MELLIIIAVTVAGIAYFLWKDRKYEESGSHPLDGPTKSSTLPEGESKSAETTSSTPNVLDVNKDGKVDLKDAVAAVDIAVEKTKKTARKTKAAVKSTATKVKTTVKKAAAKKAKK